MKNGSDVNVFRVLEYLKDLERPSCSHERHGASWRDGVKRVSCLDCGCTFKTFVHTEAPNFLDCAECGEQRCIRVAPMWLLE